MCVCVCVCVCDLLGISLFNNTCKLKTRHIYISDLAIGSYLSNNVVLLYGQPVIYMDAWIKVTVAGLELERRQQAMIKRNAAEIKIQTCFKFTNTDTQSLCEYHIKILS